MRWPFGRRSTPTEGATAPGNAPGTSPAPARPRDAWRTLPAVQRTIGRPPVVAPAAAFAERLATRQPPDLALAPLGHEVSPLASPGVLIGLVSTTEAANTGRPELPLQRHVADGHGLALEGPGWSQFDGAEPALEPTHLAVGVGPDSEAALGAVAVHSSGTIAPDPVPVVQRLAPPAPLLTASSSTTVTTPPAGTVDLRPRSAPASPPPISTPPAVAQRTAGGPAPSQPPLVEATLPVRRPTLGQARRLGLGAPLPIGPDGAVQRVVASRPVGPVAGLWPTPVGAPLGAMERASGAPLGGIAAAGGEDAPRAPLATMTEPGSAAARDAVQLTVVRPLSIQRLASGPAAAAVERASRAADLPPTGPRATGIDTALTIQRLPSDDRAPSGSAGEPPSGGVGLPEIAALPVPIVVAEAVGRTPIQASSVGSLLDPPTPSRPGGASPARQPGGASQPVVARTIAGDPGRPSPATAGGTTLDVGRTTSLQREPVGPVAPRGAAASAGPNEPTLSTGSMGLPAGASAVQRAVEVRELVITTQADNRGPAAGPAGGETPGSTPVAAGAPPSIADRDRELDELARRLYGRIRTKLAAELLADRERAGLLVDLR